MDVGLSSKRHGAVKSRIYVNGKESPHFINHPLQDGYHYKAEFTSKAYDESKDKDFLPPDNLDNCRLSKNLEEYFQKRL